MLEFTLGVLVAVVAMAIYYYRRQQKPPSKDWNPNLENKIIALENENKGLYENIGSLQTLLSSKEKDLFVTEQRTQELAAKIVQEEDNNKKILSMKKSSEVRTGHIAEQLAPFLAGFNHDPRNLRYLGQPIDYIVFGKDAITFVEVKSGKSHLSYNQKNIRRLVEEGKIKWEEFRVKGTDEWKKQKKNGGNGS